MKGSKILAHAVLAVAALLAIDGVVNAQSIGAGITPPSGKSRSEMGRTTTGQTPMPGTTSTDPTTLPASPRVNPTPDTGMQGMDGMNATDRDMGVSGGTSPNTSPGPGSTGMDMQSGQGGMSDSNSMPMRERPAKPDRN